MNTHPTSSPPVQPATLLDWVNTESIALSLTLTSHTARILNHMRTLRVPALAATVLATAAVAGGDLTPLDPAGETGAYAGQAMDVQANLAAIGHRIDGAYAVRFYDHSPSGWLVSQAVSIGTRRPISLAFGDGFLGVALTGSGSAGVVLEPSEAGWEVTSELINPDTSRFNSFALAAASDEAIFISCNDTTQQYADAVLVYESIDGDWEHVQTIAPSSVTCTLFAGDIDAAGDMLVIGATKVMSCSGGYDYGAHVYLRGDKTWDHETTLRSGDSNGKWVACDGEYVISWASQTGHNSTIDWLQTWHRSGTSFNTSGMIYSGSWGFDIYFPEGMQIADGVLTFGVCDSYWGCQTNTTTNRTVYAAQRDGNYWRKGAPMTIPSGYGSTGFGRNVKTGGGSLLIGAPAFSGSKGVVFSAPLSDALACPADFNGDGQVNVSDLMDLLADWGGTGRSDLDGDSTVGVTDLLTLLGAWGEC